MEAYATTNSASSNYEVFTGVWTNWSRGSVLGPTLTLKRHDGDLLIAFIALFVTIVGTSFWRILCSGIHSFFSTETTRDGIYHQLQAILRNSANGASGLLRFVQAIWAWRDRESKQYRRIAPLIAFTMLVLCDGDVPVTEKGERLALLDLVDLRHPKLIARPLGWEEVPVQGLTTGSTDKGKENHEEGSMERSDASAEGGGGEKPEAESTKSIGLWARMTRAVRTESLWPRFALTRRPARRDA